MSFVKPLLELQEVDGSIRNLQKELKDIPQRQSQERERLEALEERLARAQAELQAAQLRVSDAELEISTRREKIQALKQNQIMLKTNKEFQLRNLEIAKIEGEIDRLESRQIIAMDDMFPVKQRVAEAEEELKSEQELVDGSIAELDQRLETMKAELEAAEVRRAELAKNIQDPKSSLYYERLRSKRWPVVVPLGEACVCGGCHLKQPPSVGQMVRRDNDIVPCQMCGRILYLPR